MPDWKGSKGSFSEEGVIKKRKFPWLNGQVCALIRGKEVSGLRVFSS